MENLHPAAQVAAILGFSLISIALIFVFSISKIIKHIIKHFEEYIK